MKIKALIIPKFEAGEMTGDFPGEAQLFYEKYCMNTERVDLPGLPACSAFFVNGENGVAILVTGSGKIAAGLATAAVLANKNYDTSEAYIISVGCAGGSTGYCTFGDVVLATGFCDFDLGHNADIREFENQNTEITWFHDNSYDQIAFKEPDAGLTDKVYELVRKVPLRTTQISGTVLKKNFPDAAWTQREPVVLKGTVVTGDNFWKGKYGHNNAEAITGTYPCRDPYAAVEMEEIAIANAAECAGMLDRLVSFRVVVNLDIFLKGESPEALWNSEQSYNEKIQEENSETLDIFEPAMHNLFDVASVVVDAVLSGTLK